MLNPMQNNPETLKYKLGQEIVWKSDLGKEQKGQVQNIAHWGLEVVSQDGSSKWIAFEAVLS